MSSLWCLFAGFTYFFQQSGISFPFTSVLLCHRCVIMFQVCCYVTPLSLYHMCICSSDVLCHMFIVMSQVYCYVTSVLLCHRCVAYSQPGINNLIVLGCILCFCCIFLLGLDGTYSFITPQVYSCFCQVGYVTQSD